MLDQFSKVYNDLIVFGGSVWTSILKYVKVNWGNGISFYNTQYVQIIHGTPTVSVGAGAGTGGTATITGVDGSMVVTLNTGNACSASALAFRVTYGVPYIGGSTPVKTAQKANTGALFGASDIYVNGTNNVGFNFFSNTTPLADNTTYIWGIISLQ